MALALQQAAVKNTSATTTVSTALGSSPTTGNILVAVVASNVAAASTSMTSPGTGWSTIVQQNTNANNSVSIFARVVVAAESATYTATATAATTMFLTVYEISGAPATVAEAIQYSNSNTSGASSVATLSVGTLSPPAGHSGLSINGIFWQGGTTTSQSIDGTFSIVGTGTIRGTSAHLVIAATSGSYNPSYSWTTSRLTATASIMVLARPTIVKSESVTVAESAVVGVAVPNSASLTDSVTVAESVNLTQVLNINKSETVTTTESVATPVFTTGFNISLSESVSVTEAATVNKQAPVLLITDLTMVAQETGTPYPDNPYIAGEFNPTGTYTRPSAVNDTRTYDIFAGDLGFAWDDGSSGVLVAFGDTFGHNWTGPNVTTAGGTGSPTIAAGSNGVNVNTFTGSGTLNLSSVSAFNTTGGVAAVELSSASNALVYISYTGKSGATLTGCKTLLSASGTLTTGDRAKANDGWTGAGWRSNVLAYSTDTNLSDGYVISDFKNKTSQGIAQEVVSAAHDGESITNVYTASAINISTIVSTYFLINVTTSTANNAVVGQWVQISGTTNFNGEYQITEIVSATQFRFVRLMGDFSESTGTIKLAVNPNVASPMAGPEGSIIPAGGISIANGGGVGITRQYLFYWSVIYFSDVPGQWWSNYGGIAYSDNGGSTWTKATGSTTVAAGSNGVDVNTFAGAGTLNVASTSNFATTTGEVEVDTSGGTAFLSYTGKSGTTLTGVALVSGSGTLSTGNGVRKGMWGNNASFTDNYQQMWPVKGQGDGYVYLMSARNGRYGEPRMARVLEANILKKSSYTYWNATTKTWGTDSTAATTIFPDTGTVSEPSMYYNSGTGAWVTTYADVAVSGIVLRSAWSPEGPWSAKQTILLGSDFGSNDMYGGFIHPWSNTAPNSSYDLFFHISLFAPYATYLMKATLGTALITETETVAVTESKKVEISSQVNKSDSVAVTENVSLAIISTPLISVSDSTTVSEAVALSITPEVLVSDNTSLSESTTVLITELNISVNDSTSVSESVQLLAVNQIIVSDSTTVTENVNLAVSGGALNISVSDSISSPPKFIYTTDGDVMIYVFKSGTKWFYEKI